MEQINVRLPNAPKKKFLNGILTFWLELSFLLSFSLTEISILWPCSFSTLLTISLSKHSPSFLCPFCNNQCGDSLKNLWKKKSRMKALTEQIIKTDLHPIVGIAIKQSRDAIKG